MKNPKFKYYQIKNKSKIQILQNPKNYICLVILVVLGFGIYYSVVGTFLFSSGSYYFNQHSFRTTAVKFSIENLLPGAKI
jgi:hypothetical protein